MYTMLTLILRMNDSIKFFILFDIISLIVLTVLYHFFKKKHKKFWLFMSALPLIVFIIFCGLNYIKGNAFLGYQRYAGLGVAALIIFIWGLAAYFRKSFAVYTVISYILAFSCCIETLYVVLVISDQPYVTNFSHYGWTESFEKMIDELEQTYVLANWKEINFDKIRSDYIPKIEEAEKENDEVKYIMALYELRYDLYDGHIWIKAKNSGAENEACERMTGNDYGFSMFRDNTGSILAVLTDKSGQAYKKGIHDGTVITKWDGIAIDDAVSKVKCIDDEFIFSNVENEEIFKPVFLAGKGGDEISVTFIDDNNQEQTAMLEKTGSYYTRLHRAICRVYRDNIYSNQNFYTCMLNDNCGYLRVNSERPDVFGKDEIYGALSGNYPKRREKIKNDIEALEQKGMDRIIIDIRNNRGGYSFISNAVSSLFTDDPVMPEVSSYINGEFVTFEEAKTIGKAEWDNIPIVVLVNGETCSAGDCLAYNLSQSDNAVLIGNTTTWGCAQAIGGNCILSDDRFEVWYPIFASLTNDHEPIADPKCDRKARITLDYQITYDKEGVLQLFGDSDGEDYVLDQALEYISKTD